MNRKWWSLWACFCVLVVLLASGCGEQRPADGGSGKAKQGVVLFNATFASGNDGFSYADDTFGTSAPNGASGAITSGQARVTLGQAPNSGANSGGWTRTFTATGSVAVSFNYSLQAAEFFEDPECAEVRVRIDQTTYGNGGNPYVVRICSGGSSSGTFSFTSNSLGAGTHSITIGAYLNGNTFSDEIATLDIDNVVVDGNSETPSCGDAACNGSETCSTCPADCGACSAGAFLQSAGMVVMEAENATGSASSATHNWAADSTGTPSGGQARRANPNSGASITTNFVTASPRLSYLVNFSQTGTYAVWIRGRDPGPSTGSNDSAHVGLDGLAVASSDNMNGWNNTAFRWSRSTTGGNATLPITSTGLHTVNVYMREDGFAFDKLLLTTNMSFTPSGTGPAESPRESGCGDSACNGTETCSSCPGDCGACPPVCGDGACNGTETCSSCPGDCGACPPVCGDSACNGTETCSSCPGDCGACPPVCGDSACNGTETCSSCPGDCGTCSSSGLDSRPPNPTCIAPPPLATGYTLTRIWPSLTFNEPLGLLQAPGNDNTFYVLEKTGRARAVPAANTSTTTHDFINLSDVVVTESEGGLLGMAFHPNYATNRFVFVVYTPNVPGTGFVTRLSRFTSTDGGLTLNRSTELVLFNHPKTKFNHNAGNIAFGPDGYLYVSLGDDAYQDFTRALLAADPNTWYGKVLRLDVNVAPYAIPPSNPFASGGGRPEVYAYGFRNPWRFSFDRLSGELWLADVGEDTWEEIDRVTNGGFYGWPHREADLCRPNMNCGLAYQGPEFAYAHAGPASITGGFVYRGTRIPELYGHYLYGDFITGDVWAYDIANTQTQTIRVGGGNLSSWGQDNAGELYAVIYSSGTIERLDPVTVSGPTDFPALITETGCFNPANPTQVVAGAIPYSVALPFWSDGVAKERYLALPDGTRISIDADGDWTLPPGGVTIKNFRHQGQLFETRFFVRHVDGSYAGYTYEWNAAQTQATLVAPGGKSRSLPGLQWTYPSRSGCFACHTEAAGSSLSLETRQLNISSFYPTTGRTANQLVTLDDIDMLSGNLASMSPLPAADDTALPILDRAKAYLHVNCSNCHRPTGPGRGPMDARFSTLFGDMRLCNEPPSLGDLGVPGALLLTPGDHMASVAWLRMSQRTADFMPPLASSIPDAAGAALLQQWIDGISSCPSPTVLACSVAGNRVTNCNFGSGQAPWVLRLNGGAGSSTVVNGELRIDVSNPGSLDWHVQEIQILGPLSAGSHEISFEARATSPRNIVVNVGEEGDDYSSFCQRSIALTTTMQSFTIACGSLPADNNVKIDFNVGNPGSASVFVDNVYFGPPR